MRKKPESVMVTRDSVETVSKRHRMTEEEVLQAMEKLIGVRPEVVEHISDAAADGHPTVIVGSIERVLPHDVLDKCGWCSGPVYHRPNLPEGIQPICVDCWTGSLCSN